jgi:predicted  nucleic acid-binding Zn-ribbon protein
MNDETYEQLRDMEQGIPMVSKPKDTIESRISNLEGTISKQQKLIDLCLEAIERFGSNHQASYQSFVQEFDRINTEDA